MLGANTLIGDCVGPGDLPLSEVLVLTLNRVFNKTMGQADFKKNTAMVKDNG